MTLGKQSQSKVYNIKIPQDTFIASYAPYLSETKTVNNLSLVIDLKHIFLILDNYGMLQDTYDRPYCNFCGHAYLFLSL